ncbi:hypothetical protein CYMTET_16737 [Cymbomonas tetramitiformis]|uniref:Uncharacterized protein n=1 Tax=Cymbomonas tetramitiformis TaxID=36881 RepID=A0AAE0L805_9CHLO|nr:hypothetical protein CYMTET_16737 [Cymbomonas tetramitiformis]
MQLYAATVTNLQDLKDQVSSREYARMLRHGALRHEGGIPVKYFAGINFGRARALNRRDEYPAQSNRFAVLPVVPSDQSASLVAAPSNSQSAQRGFPEDDPSSSSGSESSLSEKSVSPERERRYRSSSSDDSEERSRGRRRFKKKKKKKKKKSKKPKKRSKFTAEEKGKARAVAVEENHPLTPEMAVKTLLKDKALRDQAFECLPAERQLAIASAKAAGEEVHWEQEGWEAMMAAQRRVLQERGTPHPLPVCSPTPKDTDLVWYEHTKSLHPTLSAEDAWQLAVHNHSGASTAQTSGTGGGVSSSVSSGQPLSSKTAAHH